MKSSIELQWTWSKHMIILKVRNNMYTPSYATGGDQLGSHLQNTLSFPCTPYHTESKGRRRSKRLAARRLQGNNTPLLNRIKPTTRNHSLSTPPAPPPPPPPISTRFTPLVDSTLSVSKLVDTVTKGLTGHNTLVLGRREKRSGS